MQETLVAVDPFLIILITITFFLSGKEILLLFYGRELGLFAELPKHRHVQAGKKAPLILAQALYMLDELE